jgi:hypothetical protein
MDISTNVDNVTIEKMFEQRLSPADIEPLAQELMMRIPSGFIPLVQLLVKHVFRRASCATQLRMLPNIPMSKYVPKSGEALSTPPNAVLPPVLLRNVHLPSSSEHNDTRIDRNDTDQIIQDRD